VIKLDRHWQTIYRYDADAEAERRRKVLAEVNRRQERARSVRFAEATRPAITLAPVWRVAAVVTVAALNGTITGLLAVVGLLMLACDRLREIVR
jgi:hypothetical protein